MGGAVSGAPLSKGGAISSPASGGGSPASGRSEASRGGGSPAASCPPSCPIIGESCPGDASASGRKMSAPVSGELSPASVGVVASSNALPPPPATETSARIFHVGIIPRSLPEGSLRAGCGSRGATSRLYATQLFSLQRAKTGPNDVDHGPVAHALAQAFDDLSVRNREHDRSRFLFVAGHHLYINRFYTES